MHNHSLITIYEKHLNHRLSHYLYTVFDNILILDPKTKRVTAIVFGDFRNIK